jgi:hypothetical protein
MHRVKVTVTTDGSGDAVAYSPRLAGKVHSVSYVKPGSGSYADGVDFTITSEATGEKIWEESNVNATAYRYPRAGTHSNAGVAALFAAAGTAVQDKIALAQDRIKIVVAQGGAAKVGAFHFCID